MIVRALWTAGLNAAEVTRRYAPLRLGPSDSVIRLSVHGINDDADVSTAAELIRTAVARDR